MDVSIRPYIQVVTATRVRGPSKLLQVLVQPMGCNSLCWSFSSTAVGYLFLSILAKPPHAADRAVTWVVGLFVGHASLAHHRLMDTGCDCGGNLSPYPEGAEWAGYTRIERQDNRVVMTAAG